MLDLLQAIWALSTCKHERTGSVRMIQGERAADLTTCLDCGAMSGLGGFSPALLVRAVLEQFPSVAGKVYGPPTLVYQATASLLERGFQHELEIVKAARAYVACVHEKRADDGDRSRAFDDLTETVNYGSPEMRRGAPAPVEPAAAASLHETIVRLLEEHSDARDRMWILRAVADTVASVDPTEVMSAVRALVDAGRLEEMTSGKGTFYRVDSVEAAKRRNAAPAEVPAKVLPSFVGVPLVPPLGTMGEVRAWVKFAASALPEEIPVDGDPEPDTGRARFADAMVWHLRTRLTPLLSRALVGKDIKR